MPFKQLLKTQEFNLLKTVLFYRIDIKNCTNDFLKALFPDIKIPISELIQVRKGGTPELQA